MEKSVHEIGEMFSIVLFDLKIDQQIQDYTRPDAWLGILSDPEYFIWIIMI